MAIPTSVITLASIQGEYGGENPISLSEYYSGGGFVRPEVTAVAVSGAISMGSFAGTSQPLPNSPKTGIAIPEGTFKGGPLSVTLNADVSTTANPNVGGKMRNQYFNVSGVYYNKRITGFAQGLSQQFTFGISAETTTTNTGWTNINMVNENGTYNLSRASGFFSYSSALKRATWTYTSANAPDFEFLFLVSAGTSCTVTFT